MSSELQDSVILITSSAPNNSRFGTGFVIYRDEQATYLLTCAHVVRDVGGLDQVEADGRRATVIASGEADGIDLSVLRVEGLFDKPPLGLCVSGEKGSPFITAGYQSFDKGFLIREIRGNLAGQTGFKHRGQTNRVRTWDLKTIDEYHLQPGCSGSPVLDESRSYVLGIVSHRIGESEKGVAISIAAIEKIWQEMPSDLVKVNVRQTAESMLTPKVIEVFFCYSRTHKDTKLRDALEKRLSGLIKQGIITCWHDGKIGAGKNEEREINIHLNAARIILFLISPDFMDWYYSCDSQVIRAMERYEAGEVSVIPILLQQVDWSGTEFSNLQPLPSNREFVDSRFWKNQNEAFFSITTDIRIEVDKITPK